MVSGPNHTTAELWTNALLLDLYGRGYSDAPHTTYDANLYTTQLALLLQYVGWNKADIVGVSMVSSAYLSLRSAYLIYIALADEGGWYRRRFRCTVPTPGYRQGRAHCECRAHAGASCDVLVVSESPHIVTYCFPSSRQICHGQLSSSRLHSCK